MGKNSFYLGEVGNATKMNLVLQTMMGVTLAGLAEGMALADRAGLQQKDVLEVLELTGLACPILLNKGKSIIDGGFPTHQPLQHMQKDLKLSLSMGDTLEQPLPLTASANEVSAGITLNYWIIYLSSCRCLNMPRDSATENTMSVLSISEQDFEGFSFSNQNRGSVLNVT